MNFVWENLVENSLSMINVSLLLSNPEIIHNKRKREDNRLFSNEHEEFYRNALFSYHIPQ